MHLREDLSERCAQLGHFDDHSYGGGRDFLDVVDAHLGQRRLLLPALCRVEDGNDRFGEEADFTGRLRAPLDSFDLVIGLGVSDAQALFEGDLLTFVLAPILEVDLHPVEATLSVGNVYEHPARQVGFCIDEPLILTAILGLAMQSLSLTATNLLLALEAVLHIEAAAVAESQDCHQASIRCGCCFFEGRHRSHGWIDLPEDVTVRTSLEAPDPGQFRMQV
ncbi:MAG: hypothetical protein ACYTG5_04565 [Planctomycetota bacterium]